MPKIKGLSHVVLYVNDLDKMVAFYRDVLGFITTHENPGRMVFMTPDPEIDDHQIALAKGREGEAKIIGHIAWRVETPTDVKAFYKQFKARGVPIEACVSYAYAEMGNTVSCNFFDPEGNRLEVYSLVPERDDSRITRKLDLDKSVDDIIAQASGLETSSR